MDLFAVDKNIKTCINGGSLNAAAHNIGHVYGVLIKHTIVEGYLKTFEAYDWQAALVTVNQLFDNIHCVPPQHRCDQTIRNIVLHEFENTEDALFIDVILFYSKELIQLMLRMALEGEHDGGMLLMRMGVYHLNLINCIDELFV